jgi:alpha-D-xyloside xylohydrolase
VLLVSGLCLVIAWAPGQDVTAPDAVHSPQRVVSFEHINKELVLKCDAGLLVIKAYADNIIHVSYFPGAEKASLPFWGFGTDFPEVKYRIDSTMESLRLATNQLAVSVDRKTAQVTFLDAKQNVLLTSKGYYLKEADAAGKSIFRVHADFVAPDDEAYYGLGQHQSGWMDQRGKTVQLGHDREADGGEIIAVPFLVTNRKYGFIFDNPSKTTVLPGKSGLTTWDAETGDALSYFVIYGAATDDLYKGYRLLTGTTPLPPKYALGYMQGKQNCKTQDELLQVARKYREKDYPADMLVLNPSDMGMDEKLWPDLGSMNSELNKLGFKVMISCSPRLPKESPDFDALDSKACFVKDQEGRPLFGLGQDKRGAWIDVTKQECGTWFWNAIHKNYASKGFTSWWLDESEPDVPSDDFFLDKGTGTSVFDLYPLMQVKAVYEGHRQDMKERCLIVTRSAYLGAQEYGTTFRSSDLHSQWDVLKRQIPAGLNLAASGLAYWSSDIGGSGTGHDGADYPELFVRWFEYGAFCPTFRTYGGRPENEVWSYGEAAEKILVKYLQLRYRLLPYIYSLAHSVTETGAPFMRALFMDFPQDPEVRDIKDEYMFGPAFLVAPVVEQGKNSREVYLPKGAAWYDYWTGKKYPGGQRISADASLDVLPLFVRAGSIIPHGNDVPNARAEQRNVVLYVYAGADARFDLYQDDGTTYDYEKGKFSLAQIRWDEATQKITFTGDYQRLFSGPQDRWLKIIK